MSSFRRISTNNPGDDTRYGANDFHVIVDLLNGVTSSIPPVKFESTSGVTFWDNICKFRDSDDSNNISIRTPNNTADRDLNIPVMTANDTFVLLALTQTLTNKTFNISNNSLTVTSGALGDILKHNGTKFDRFAKGTANQYLRMDGSGVDLVWTDSTVSAHASTHGEGQSDALKLDDLAIPDDVTDLDASTTRHGLLLKLGGGTTNFLRADGTWSAPPGAAGGEANTASNVGTGGVGVFKTKNALDLEFKNINAGSSKISVTNDVTFNEVDIDVVESNINVNNTGGGAVSVSKGGTGATTLTGVLVGNGTSAFTTLGAPASSLVGISDTQTLTNKTFSSTSNTITSTSLSTGDLLKSNGSKYVRFGIGAAGKFLAVNSGGTDLEWASPTITTFNTTTGTITSTSIATGDILKSNGTKYVRLARGSANQVLSVNSGGTDVEWADPATGSGSTAGIIADMVNNSGYIYGWYSPFSLNGNGILNGSLDVEEQFDTGGSSTPIWISGTNRGLGIRYIAPDTDYAGVFLGKTTLPFAKDWSSFVDFWLKLGTASTLGCRAYAFFTDDISSPAHTSDTPLNSQDGFGIMATGTGNWRMVTNNGSASQTLGGSDLFAKDQTLRHIRIELDEANSKGIITVDGTPTDFTYASINEPTAGTRMAFHLNIDETGGNSDQYLEIYRFHCGSKYV